MTAISGRVLDTFNPALESRAYYAFNEVATGRNDIAAVRAYLRLRRSGIEHSRGIPDTGESIRRRNRIDPPRNFVP